MRESERGRGWRINKKSKIKVRLSSLNATWGHMLWSHAAALIRATLLDAPLHPLSPQSLTCLPVGSRRSRCPLPSVAHLSSCGVPPVTLSLAMDVWVALYREHNSMHVGMTTSLCRLTSRQSSWRVPSSSPAAAYRYAAASSPSWAGQRKVTRWLLPGSTRSDRGRPSEVSVAKICWGAEATTTKAGID